MRTTSWFNPHVLAAPIEDFEPIQEMLRRHPDGLTFAKAVTYKCPPPHIIKAYQDALESGYVRYGPSRGLPQLREAIARKLPAAGRAGWQHMVLPTLTMSAYSIGLVTRLVRASMLEELRQAYITTARGKGLSEVAVYHRHALRNALIPTVTVIGLQFGQLLGGSIVIETVFAWPGIGWLMIQAIYARDLPLIRADVLVLAVLFVLINLMVDVSYAYLDPRIRYE